MSSAKEKLTEFHDRFRQQAEDVVTKSFPGKVFELDKLLKSDLFSKNEIEKVHNGTNLPSPLSTKTHNDVEPATKKRRVSNEHFESHSVQDDHIPANQYLLTIIDILKPHIQFLMEQCNMVKMWIQLQIPRIEDGNNFGVSIQEETLGEVQRIEGEAATFLDQISRYYITRGKIASKVVKYPHLEDYRRAVLELDEKEFITLRLCCCELRNHYLCLHDSITKNIDKIKKPRTSNAHSLY